MLLQLKPILDKIFNLWRNFEANCCIFRNKTNIDHSRIFYHLLSTEWVRLGKRRAKLHPQPCFCKLTKTDVDCRGVFKTLSNI